MTLEDNFYSHGHQVALVWGGSSLKLKGGNLQSGRQKYSEKEARQRRAEILGPLFRRNSLVFQLNNALIYMFPTFRTKHEKIWVRIRGALLAENGAPS